MPRAKTIQVFLPDGDPQSVRIADITSRMVQATQVPRGVLSSAERRPELKQVGVYFLFGPTEEGSVPPVYIGESENCWVRLKQHHVDESKEWWTQAIVVTSKTQAFDKAQGRWLEWHATQKAQQVGRYAVGNQCAASQPHLAEPVRARSLRHDTDAHRATRLSTLPAGGIRDRHAERTRYDIRARRALLLQRERRGTG